ncbi:MAG: hypothetical protein V1835_07165 [Candidatus Micrarchaeota archaeon]
MPLEEFLKTLIEENGAAYRRSERITVFGNHLSVFFIKGKELQTVLSGMQPEIADLKRQGVTYRLELVDQGGIRMEILANRADILDRAHRYLLTLEKK